jgi:predicted lipoprotein
MIPRCNLFRPAAVLAAALLIAVPAPAATAAGTPIDYAAINAAIIKDHLLPRYHVFTVKTAALSEAAEKLCPGAEPAALDGARTAFHDALDAWQEVEHLRQGPAAAAETHIRVKFWPDRKSLVDKHLARLMAGKDAAILKADSFAHVSIAVQGFPALERLLFAKDAAAALKAGDGPVTPCAVAGAIAVNLHAIAADLEGRWMKDPAAGRPAKRVTTDLFNDLATGLGAIAEMKLGAPLGADGKTRPRRAENWLSGRALRNVVHNLIALEDLYDGLATAEGGHIGKSEDDLIRHQFAYLIKFTRDLGPSITEVLKTDKGPLRIKVLKSDLQDLHELVVVNVSEALNLVLGFNSLDGD